MASARLWNTGSPNSMRQGPTRSMMARRTGSDFFRWLIALRMRRLDETRIQEDIRSVALTLVSPLCFWKVDSGLISGESRPNVGSTTLGKARLGVGPVDLPQGVADLADGRIRAHRIHDVRHSIRRRNIAARSSFRLLDGGPLQRIETAPNFLVRPPGPQCFQFCTLMPGYALVNV